MLLDQEAPIVLHLVEAVGDMLGFSASARSLNTSRTPMPSSDCAPKSGAAATAMSDTGCRWSGCGRAGRARACAPRPGLPRRDVDHVAVRPDRVLDADVERDQPVLARRRLQRRDVERDAVEPVVAYSPSRSSTRAPAACPERRRRSRRGSGHGRSAPRRRRASRRPHRRGAARAGARPAPAPAGSATTVARSSRGIAAGDIVVERRRASA